jgi:hypothetical protein
MVYSSPVDVVETLQNQILSGFHKINDMPKFWDRLQVTMNHRAVACIHAIGGHMEHLL